MPHLYDLDGQPMTWAELEERRVAYYARKAQQEPPPTAQFEARRYPGSRGYYLVRVK